MKTKAQLTSYKPYFVKSFYDWLLANKMTPQVIVVTSFPGVDVPATNRGEEGDLRHKIILSLGKNATHGLRFDLDQGVISFHATFAGNTHFVRIPMEAVASITAKETGEGSVFDVDYASLEKKPEQSPKKPRLQIVKA